jgi:hypothetical protein
VARGGGNSSIALQLPANESTTADTRESRQKMEEELVQEEVECMNKAHALLKAVMEHLSNNFGDAPCQADADADADDDDGIAYDTDTEEDDAREEQVGVSSNPKKRYKRSYQPPRGSVLGEYLFNLKEKVKKGTLAGFNKSKGQKWIPPPADPVSGGIGNEPVPNRWYLGRIWVYVWLPLEAHDNRLPKGHTCGECNTNSKGLYWRPMIHMDKSVWILHQQFKCNNPKCCGSPHGKKRSFASIDPRALLRLPTRVAERFEFITTAGGIGIHQSMMYMFAALVTTSYGAWTIVWKVFHTWMLSQNGMKVVSLDILESHQRHHIQHLVKLGNIMVWS